MQSRAVNSFSASEVDSVFRGVARGIVKYRIRFELLDIDNLVIRSLTNIITGEIRHSAEQLIKRTAHFTIQEADLELDPYDELVVEDGAMFYYRLGEPSGTNANDSTDNNRDGTYQNTPTLNQTSLLAGDTSNGSVTLNGTNEYISNTDQTAYDTTTGSWEIWAQTTATSGTMINRDDGASNRQINIAIDSSGNVVATLTFATPATVAFTAVGAVNDGLPHHVLVTYNGARVAIYVDSVRLLNTAETRTLASVTLGYNIGRSQVGGGSLYWTGSLDEAAVYGAALTAAQGRNHYQKGVADLNEIDYLRDRIKPWVGVEMPDTGTDGTNIAEWPLGVFVLANPRRVGTEFDIQRDVQGFDQSVILLNDRVSTRYSVTFATNYITAVQSALTSSGFTAASLALTPTSLTLPSTREWIIGTSKMDIINDLLNAINYRPLWFNGNGQAVAEPFVLPASRASEITYTADAESMILPEIEATTNLFEIPNKVILSRTNPKTGTINGIATNTKLSSPTSLPRTGGIPRTFFDGNIDAADQTTITQLAQRVLTEKSQIYQDLRLKTWLAPYHEDMDYVTVVDESMGISAGFIEYEWAMALVETGEMDHLLRYVVDVV